MPHSSNLPTTRDLTILLLALAGAGVDVVVIMGFNVLTAAQTGNTILFSAAIAREDFETGLKAAVSVANYIIGTACAESIIIRHPDSRPGFSGISRTLSAEIFLLGVLFLYCYMVGIPHLHTTFLPISLAAAAMGIQSATVKHIQNGPTTTYITGVLTSFTTAMIRSSMAPKITSSSETTGGHAGTEDSLLQFGLVWTTYVAGAITSGYVYWRAGEIALLMPLCAVMAAITLNRRR